MAHPRLTRLLVRKLRGIERIKELLSERYEFIDDARYAIRREEAVEYVADKMGVTVYEHGLRRQVRIAGAALGWDPIAPRGARLFSCAKHRNQTNKEALAHSKTARPKPQERGMLASERLAL